MQRLLARSTGAPLTYGELDERYSRDTATAALGAGKASFERGRQGLREWRAHRGVGFHVHPAGVPPTRGAEVVVAIPLGPVRLLAPCRVVAVVDEAQTYGFTYGTLPGHPEAGEESFTVTLDDDGVARFTVTVASRPADPVARLGGPVTLFARRRALRGYVGALRRYVAGNP